MATVRISELPPASAVSTSVVPVSTADGTATNKTTLQDIADLATVGSHASTHATGGSDAIAPADIGAAPAASPTFTGTVTVPGLTSTGQILADDSTSTSAPVYSFDGDVNCGIAHPAADTVAVSTAGVERVRVDASGNIRLGGFTSNSGVNVIAPNASGTDAAGGTFVIGGSQGTGTGSGGAVVFATAAAGASSGSSVNGRVSRMQVKSTGAVRFVPLASDPATGEAGDVYYNSTTNKLRVYNGTSWVDLH